LIEPDCFGGTVDLLLRKTATFIVIVMGPGALCYVAGITLHVSVHQDAYTHDDIDCNLRTAGPHGFGTPER
jgi:hypothetical protein